MRQELAASRVTIARSAALAGDSSELLKLVLRNHPLATDFLPQASLAAKLTDALGTDAQSFGDLRNGQKIEG